MHKNAYKLSNHVILPCEWRHINMYLKLYINIERFN